MAARLLGRCSQSAACSPARAAPRVSSAPEEETNKKAPVSHSEAALWDICLFLTTGLHSSVRRETTERFFRTRASGKQNDCCFKLCVFFQCKCHFQSLLACGGSPPLFFFVLLNLWAVCPVLLYEHILSEKQENCPQQQADDAVYLQYSISQPESLTLDSCWRTICNSGRHPKHWNKCNFVSCEACVPANRSDLWGFCKSKYNFNIEGILKWELTHSRMIYFNDHGSDSAMMEIGLPLQICITWGYLGLF